VDETQLFVGGTARSDLGVRDDDRRQRVTARATAGRQFTNQFDAQATVGVTWREHQLPFQGNLVFPVNLLDAGLFGDAVNDTSHGYLPNVDASTAEARQKTNHVTGSIGVHWQPASWLRAAGVGGLDRVDVDNSELQHSPFQPPSLRERAIAETENEATYTLGFEAAANYRAWALFAAQTALGFDYRRTHLSSESLAGPPGAPSQFRSVVMNSRSKGFWARQTLLWRERVAIDGGLRWSGADAFGASQPSDLHKSLSASWLVGATSARSVRLRAAYGDATGDLPRDALVFIAPQPFGDAIDPLRAERTSEEELGLDAALDHGIVLALTAFRATSSRVMLDVALPPSNGFPSTVVRNVGRMRNTGVEALARVRLVDRSSFRWNASLSFATLRNRVLSLDGVPPLIAATYRIQAGYPVRGLWSLPYTYSDANRDGIVDTSEVQLGAERVVRGAPFPTREAALRSRMSFPAGFGLDAVLDYRGGYALENLNESFRCRAVFNCRATNDPSTPLVDQARAAAALKGARSYIQDASFLKLREVTARWSVPASWTRAMRASAIELSVAARDAGTWTDYDGLDPEITALGTEELPRSDFSKQPITRRFVLRIDIDGALR
jgi:outer membrane receptor protein involved in Fe transport